MDLGDDVTPPSLAAVLLFLLLGRPPLAGGGSGSFCCVAARCHESEFISFFTAATDLEALLVCGGGSGGAWGEWGEKGADKKGGREHGNESREEGEGERKDTC